MPDILSAEVYARILDADLKNILKKAASGKTLSPAEHARVVAKAAGCDDSTTIAKTIVELATLLGTNRRQIARWQKLKGVPPANPNGSHDVVAWREFVREHGLKAAKVSSEVDFAALKARKTLAEIEEREIKVAIKKGDYVPLSQVRREWMTQVGKARALFDARLLNELPPILVGKDAVAIREETGRVLMEIYETLHAGESCTP